MEAQDNHMETLSAHMVAALIPPPQHTHTMWHARKYQGAHIIGMEGYTVLGLLTNDWLQEMLP